MLIGLRWVVCPIGGTLEIITWYKWILKAGDRVVVLDQKGKWILECEILERWSQGAELTSEDGKKGTKYTPAV